MTGRILLVDDDRTVVESIAKTLASNGYDIDIARDGQRAVLLAATLKPDLILLDINLPRMSGLEVLKRVRSMPGPPAKILMMTAMADKETIIQAIYAGANDYLVKPFEPEMLMSKIERQLPPPAAPAGPSGRADRTADKDRRRPRRRTGGLAAVVARAIREKSAED